MAGITHKEVEDRLKLKLTSIKMSFTWIEWLDLLVARNIYPSRAEAIREAINDYIDEINNWLEDHSENHLH
ncbi:MAG: ribbon-helix-helix domain-containing protein [Candidatus Hodarchaeales archaeon]|jgi:metal-responsive CopG/Arc/MetJ family transcriptional regulator